MIVIPKREMPAQATTGLSFQVPNPIRTNDVTQEMADPISE